MARMILLFLFAISYRSCLQSPFLHPYLTPSSHPSLLSSFLHSIPTAVRPYILSSTALTPYSWLTKHLDYVIAFQSRSTFFSLSSSPLSSPLSSICLPFPSILSYSTSMITWHALSLLTFSVCVLHPLSPSLVGSLPAQPMMPR